MIFLYFIYDMMLRYDRTSLRNSIAQLPEVKTGSTQLLAKTINNTTWKLLAIKYLELITFKHLIL